MIRNPPDFTKADLVVSYSVFRVLRSLEVAEVVATSEYGQSTTVPPTDATPMRMALIRSLCPTRPSWIAWKLIEYAR